MFAQSLQVGISKVIYALIVTLFVNTWNIDVEIDVSSDPIVSDDLCEYCNLFRFKGPN